MKPRPVAMLPLEPVKAFWILVVWEWHIAQPNLIITTTTPTVAGSQDKIWTSTGIARGACLERKVLQWYSTTSFSGENNLYKWNWLCERTMNKSYQLNQSNICKLSSIGFQLCLTSFSLFTKCPNIFIFFPRLLKRCIPNNIHILQHLYYWHKCIGKNRYHFRYMICL